MLNMGVGYTLVVPVTDAAAALAAVPGAKVVGWIESRNGDEPQVIVHPGARRPMNEVVRRIAEAADSDRPAPSVRAQARRSFARRAITGGSAFTTSATMRSRCSRTPAHRPRIRASR